MLFCYRDARLCRHAGACGVGAPQRAEGYERDAQSAQIAAQVRAEAKRRCITVSELLVSIMTEYLATA
jgi:hypothetical protein